MLGHYHGPHLLANCLQLVKDIYIDTHICCFVYHSEMIYFIKE
jgi:hypothetical protein